MTTVGSLAFGIVANTSNFTAGVAGTKAELRDLKAAFLASQSPVEKYSSAIEHLEGLAAKFPEKGEALRRTIGQMRAEMEKAQSESSALGQVTSRLGIVVDPVSASFQALHLATGLARSGFHALESLVGKVADEMQRLDETAKTARNLGIDESSLVGFRRAAADISGVASEEFDKAFLKFGVNLGNAAAGLSGGEQSKGILDRLGLDASKLSGLSIDKALLEVSKALQTVENADERLALSKGLLGKGGERLATMLAAGDKEILQLAADQNALAQTDFINFEAVERANDEIGRLSSSVQGAVSLIASDFAPLVGDIASEFTTAFMGASENGAEFRDVIHEAALATARLVDKVEAVVEAGTRLKALAGTGLGTAATTLGRNAIQQLPGGGAAVAAFDAGSTFAGYALGGEGGAHTLAVQRAIAEGNSSRPGQTAAEIAAKASEAEERKAKTDADKAEKDRLDEIGRMYQAQADARSRDFKAQHKEQQELIDLAEKWTDKLKTPSEKLKEDFAQLQDLNASGAIGAADYQRGLADLRDKAQAASGANITPQTVAAVRAGSVEALRAQYNGKGGTPEKQLEEQRRQREEQQRATALLGDIKAALSGGLIAEAT